MPHIAIKMWPGRSEQQKQELADRLAAVVRETTGAPDSYITVTIEDVDAAVWPRQVFKPDIAEKADKLYKKPGYGYTDEEMGV